MTNPKSQRPRNLAHDELNPRWILCLLFAVYIALSVLFFWVNQNCRPIWQDEAWTYYQVKNRSLSGLLGSFDLGVNLLPYSYFLILWGVENTIGLDELSLRLPSLIFAASALIVSHLLLQRHFGSALTFFSVFNGIVLSAFFSSYVAEARPYALYFLVAIVSVWVAKRLHDDQSNKAWAINAAVAAIFPSIHFVGLVYSGFLAIAVMALKPKRCVAIGFSFATGWLTFLILHYRLLTVVFGGQGFSDPDWIERPTLANAMLSIDTFFDLFPEVSVAIIVLVVAKSSLWKASLTLVPTPSV